MRRAGRLSLIISTIALICGTAAAVRADRSTLVAMVVGRTGEVLHIATPQPVREGTIFAIKPFEGEDAIAEAQVLSCTRERPFIALARVIRGDTIFTVPTGVRAYTDASSVDGSDVPALLLPPRSPDKDRFSLQAGAFYPMQSGLRETTSEYWPSYRLNYSFVRMGQFEALLSGEYSKGTGEINLGGDTIRNTMEVIPVTAMARFKTLRMGNAHLFLGAGVGVYRIRSQATIGSDTLSSSRQEFGREMSVGMESTRGWVIELRYRDVEKTDIRGYLLAIGSRF
jgi:hypothetical protein